MAAKRLLLLRHGKSSWDDPALEDLDRPLAGRGRRAAARLGLWLREQDAVPELVICSPAVRARETLEQLGLPPEVPVRLDGDVYAGTAGDLLAVVRALPPHVDSAMVVGHNPAIEDLARMLVAPALDTLEKVPTAGLVDLRFPGPGWDDVGPGPGRLEALITPRTLD